METQKKFNSLTKFSVSSELSDFFLPFRCLSEKSHHRNLGGQKITFLCSQATSSLSLFWRLQVQTHTLTRTAHSTHTPTHKQATAHTRSLTLLKFVSCCYFLPLEKFKVHQTRNEIRLPREKSVLISHDFLLPDQILALLDMHPLTGKICRFLKQFMVPENSGLVSITPAFLKNELFFGHRNYS